MIRKLLLLFAFGALTISAHSQSSCVGSQALTATPLPSVNGNYSPGTVVNFCYTVSNYSQSGADWLAGVAIQLGPAWDASTLQPVTIPPSCDGLGNWGWYTSCTGTASGQTWGPGFYYDTPSGSPNFTIDGIPGNNYGDNCQSNTWTFCFSVEVGPCNPTGSGSLFVGAQALSDYQAGSWGTNACFDPPASQAATVQCCALIVPTVTVVNSSCGNTNDGSISVVPQGVAPYTYQWNNGAITSSVTNLAPGIYTVTVTDAVLCTKEVTISVGGSPPIVLNETITDNQCTTNDGSISLAPSGGNGSSYTYQWSNGLTGSAISSLAGGSYTVTVTDSLNCTSTQTFNISSFIPITLTTTSTPANCGIPDGSASVTASGGNGPYTYDWQPQGGTGSTASNLPGGAYTVTVTDADGCTTVETVTVQSSGTFTLNATFVPLGCDPQSTTTASVTVNGGTAPFTYSWSPAGGNQATGTGLSAGTYTVLVTDSNNCVDSVSVTVPPVIPISLTASSTPVQCNQPNSGTASASASGGNPPLTYLWSDGSAGVSLSGLAGGNYTVTVTDANGCTVTETVTVNVIPDVFASAGTDQTICSGDAANLNGSGSAGTAPYNYSWSNGSSNQNQTINPTATNTYTVTVSDANGCTATSSVTITVIDYPVVTVTPNTDICFGSATSLQASGGSTYSWSPADGLNDAGIANPVASPSATTTYTVTVSNAQCSSTGTVTVNVAPEIGAGFAPDTTQGQAPLTVEFSNSTSTAGSYLWDFGDGNTSADANPAHTYTEPGSYTVLMIATNSLGCTDTARFEFIVVENKSSLVIPNVFTPNGDGLNETFSFQEEGIATINVIIFNRWGREVYSWSATGKGWDGKSTDGNELPEGVYLYVVKASGVDGKTYDESGTVQLIRGK
jgi:gliding motility-associated-like protein